MVSQHLVYVHNITLLSGLAMCSAHINLDLAMVAIHPPLLFFFRICLFVMRCLSCIPSISLSMALRIVLSLLADLTVKEIASIPYDVTGSIHRL